MPPTPSPSQRTRVLVLAGGPDAERQVSLTSAKYVSEALRATPAFDVNLHTIERLTPEQLRAIPADVIVPVLHGGWGEGGPLQDILEADGRPFVFSAPAPSRLAMDKIATKMAALACGIPTPLTPRAGPPRRRLPPSLPGHREAHPRRIDRGPARHPERSGVAPCRRDDPHRIRRRVAQLHDRTHDHGAKRRARPRADRRRAGRPRLCRSSRSPPRPALYDYEAKYHRNDTVYTLDPALPPGAAETVKRQSELLGERLGTRHVARTDFMLDASGTAWLLEINTIPGFTDHSLVPKAARHAGIDMPELCARLVHMALRDHPSRA